MYRIYGDILSGNCFKLKLLCSFLEIQHQWIHIDILKDETLTPEFLAMNENGKIPVLEIEPNEYLSESNAILFFLAQDSVFLPDSRFECAKVLHWQFFEQYSHEPYVAVARYINKYLGLPEDRLEEYQSKQAGGHKALAVLKNSWLKQGFSSETIRQ